MKFTQVITGVNENNLYTGFWPSIAAHWKKHGYPIQLGFVTDRTEKDELVNKFRRFGPTVLFSPIQGIPGKNLAKLCRLYQVTQMKDTVCFIADMDHYFFKPEWWQNAVKDLPDNCLPGIGYNIYDTGQWPMSGMIVKGSFLANLINPNKLKWEEWINSLRPNVESHLFSDEFFLRDQKNAKLAEYEFFPISRPERGETRIDRYDHMHFSAEKAKKGDYLDCHASRPFSHKHKPILDLLGLEWEKCQF